MVEPVAFGTALRFSGSSDRVRAAVVGTSAGGAGRGGTGFGGFGVQVSFRRVSYPSSQGLHRESLQTSERSSPYANVGAEGSCCKYYLR